MIGRLRGTIIEKHAPLLVIDVNGVGYEVFAPMSTFYHLTDTTTQVTLFIHMVVREDAQLLYGFYSERERSLFRALIKVNGIGPKLALAILSSIEPDEFVACVLQNNSASLVAIPGVGKKTAERLIIETRDSLQSWETMENGDMTIINETTTTQVAIDALISLGYKANDAKRMVSKVAKPDMTSETLIREALKNMITV